MNFSDKTKKFAFFVCVGATLLLSACSLSGPEEKDQAAVNEPLEDRNAVIEVTENELVRTLPESMEGRGAVFQLQSDDISTETYIDLSKVALECSDGVDRTAWAISDDVGFLSNDEKKKTTDGVVSTADNLTLIGWVAARDNETVGTIMDNLSEKQAEKAEKDDSLMISDTVEIRPNVYLTDYVLTQKDMEVETFCILNILDSETVQIYLLSRTAEPNDEDADAEMSESSGSVDSGSDFLQSFISSDENRDIFCGVLQALLQKVN